MATAASDGNAPLAGGDKREERVTVKKSVRMRLNGEAGAQMAHVEAIKAAGGVSLNESDGTDTSRDQEWILDTSPRAVRADRYVLYTSILWLGLKIAVLAIPTLLFHLLPMLVVRIYVSTLEYGTQRIVRTKYFYFWFWVTFVLSIPALGVVLLSLGLDALAYYAFCLPYCACTCRWSAAKASLKKIRPYRNGPSVIRHLSDFFVCCMGQCSRQATFETWYMVSCMWLLIPWLKYYVNCNPWIYDLDHRLCQQISTEMADLGTPSEVAEQSRYIISHARPRRDIAERIDLWSFVPYYPLPPPNRRWALGLQAGGSRFPGKFSLIVHTTHASSEAGGSTEQFVLSNSCAEPIYRVMLWYSNPFHFLTGWVETSVSTGLPSQPNKRHGGEHPMWLLTARTPMVASRDSWTGSGTIDAFFDYWLPVFVHEMRRLTFANRFRGNSDGEALALNIADAKYQEVHSADGISRPKIFIGRQNYNAKDALTDYQNIAQEENTVARQWVSRILAQLAETDLGARIRHLQNDEDLHSPTGVLAKLEEREAEVVTKMEQLIGEETP